MRNKIWKDRQRLYMAAASPGAETFVMRLATGKMSQTIRRLKKSLAFQQRKYRLLHDLLLQASVECVANAKFPPDLVDLDKNKDFIRCVAEYETYNRICSAMEGIDQADRESVIQGEEDVKESNLGKNLDKVLLFYEEEGWKVCADHSVGIYFDSKEEMELFKAFALSGELLAAYKAFRDRRQSDGKL